MFLLPLRHIAPQLSGVGRRALNFLTAQSGLLVCGLFLLAGLFQVGDYGWGVDESYQRWVAQANLNYILGQADRIETSLYHDRYYGIVFELPLLLAERIPGLEDYYYAHRLRVIVIHLFFIVGGFFCYRLTYRLFGSRLLALFALLLFLLHPRIYGHSFANSKDLPFLSMFAIALYLLERAFRRDTPGAFILLGIAVGLLINLRIMGVMLVFAVIGMRGLDWFYAASGRERKAILLTGGLFLLTVVLTVYALSPYAWTNPGDYLTGSLRTTVDRPVLLNELFQGEWIPSDQLPPHYTVTWFSISTPLPFLLLGVVGIAVAATGGLRRPGAVLRNNRRRLQWLLPACFLLPPLAAALLGSDQYSDWRHLYFLYVPFCLLAAGGLRWLAAGPRRRYWRAGCYALTAAGLGLVLLQIAQLHPLQHLYFNSLVDRTTPEGLRRQYTMIYWEQAYWAGLRHLLKSYPDETLTVRTGHGRGFRLMSPAERERLRPAPNNHSADYALFHAAPTGHDQPGLVFNAAYRRFYNNTIIALQPLDSSRMTDTAVAAYQEIYRQAVAGEPVLRADYDVYRNGQRLTFVRENCPPDSRDAWFSAQPYLLPPGGTAAAIAQQRSFGNYRVRLGDTCLAVLQLPDYIRGDITLSQHNLGKSSLSGLVWEELYNWSPPGLRERLAQWRQGQPPAAPDAFAVFLDQDAAGGYRLIYAKGDCSWAEYRTQIFLHIYPENRGDLPFYLWAGGVDFALREFPWHRYGLRSGGECLAAVPLPDYPIKSLRTGQDGGWVKTLYPPADPEQLRAEYAALSGRQPNARAEFDLYLGDNRLTYWRESCAVADTAAGFYLHIIPRDAAALPGEGPPNRPANLDFDFARWGGHFDGKCLATAPLPDFPIAVIRTGQAGIWQRNLYPPADPDYLRAAYAALSGRQPVARADFDLYVQGNRLVYWRESCAAGDTAAGFFLHIVPAGNAAAPEQRQQNSHANLDFDFARWGGHFDGKCLAAVPLPEYPIAVIRTGQRIPGPSGGWSVELIPAPDPESLRAAYAALSDRQPAARARFDLYLQDNQLIYRRESCAAADTAAGFFLHIVPEDIADLPQERQAAGFANADFVFVRYGGFFDGKCLAAVALPNYPIAAIRTGQYVPGQGELWAAELAGER